MKVWFYSNPCCTFESSGYVRLRFFVLHFPGIDKAEQLINALTKYLTTKAIQQCTYCTLLFSLSLFGVIGVMICFVCFHS